MTKYIDADALMKRIWRERDFMNGKYGDAESRKARDAEYTNVMRLIGKMPAADVEPIRKWISVKERLPEEGERVLACWERHSRETNEIYTFIDIMYLLKDHWKDGYVWQHDLGTPNGKVVAWMPLPELPRTDGGNGK